MFRIFCYCLPVLLLAACVNAPDFPDEPVITYEGVNKSEIFQFINGPVDSIIFQISFTDGDGDLSQDSVDIFFTDSRLGSVTPFRIPPIPAEGTGNGISGDIFVTWVNSTGVCCIIGNRICPTNPAVPTDTVVFDVQITDRAGNLSNVIQTEPIVIKCTGE